MNSQLLKDANFVLDACGRQVPPPNTQWVDIPAHIGYSRFMTGSADPTFPGSEDIGGVMHKGRVSFFLRALTAQSLPRQAQGVYWRLRLPAGQYFQSAMTAHPMAFGLGSDRQSFSPEIEWKPGEKLYVDLDTVLAGPPPSATGYSVSMMFEGVYRFPISGPGAVRFPLGGDLPRYFVGDNQNILAPEFCFAPGCPSETPAGYTDEEFCYISPTSDLPITGSPISDVATQINTDADFIVREIWPFFPLNLANQGAGSVVVRFRRADGYAMSSNFIPAAAIQGPVFRELRVKAGDTLYYDARVVDTAGSAGNVVTAGFYFIGVKRRKVSA